MKKFLKKIFFYSVIVLGIHLVAAFFADGYTDPFYKRFTTPRQKSMIIGSSRAAQGFQPQVMDSLLHPGTPGDLFNFSFSIPHSPYGEVYLDAIASKLKKSTDDGIFILEVNPWTLSIPKDEEDEIFKEKDLILNRLHFFNVNPNVDYLVKEYPRSWSKLLYDPGKKNIKMFLHDDGWLEVNVSMKERSVKKRLAAKIPSYKRKAVKLKVSRERIAYLVKTIDFLQQHGKVFLVRLPVHNEIKTIEDYYFPEFDEAIVKIARKKSLPYYSFIDCNDRYVYTDGNHLFKESGRTVSRQVSLLVQRDSNNPVFRTWNCENK